VNQRRALVAFCVLLSMAALAACSGVPGARKAPAVSFTSNVKDHASGVPVSTLVEASADHGKLTRATLGGTDATGQKTAVPGHLTMGTWFADERLEPGAAYTLEVAGTDSDGKQRTARRTFTTEALDLGHQVYPSVAPLNGETVGVGMPIIVYFDVPVQDRATFERNMAVTADPGVEGSWSWLSDREVHWRPREFWAPGTHVHVFLDLNGLPAGGGIFGQQDQQVDFTIGRSAVSTVDVAHHSLTYRQDGRVLRTIAVTTGDGEHQTRAGTKVIMELHPSIDMDARTTGVDSEEPGYYNIKDVRWAMRLTNSGEFLHAAPWSVGSQGRANVSHGCTGMSTANADWLFYHSMRGDVVQYIRSARALEPGNGWTDWNVPWERWTAGSALADEPTPPASPSASRL
jgi:lipoprotein-anchoring transpeptidase ErfK/SrfK